MVLYPNKLPESERVCSGICKLPNVMILFEVFLKDMIRLSEREAFFFLEERHNEFV